MGFFSQRKMFIAIVIVAVLILGVLWVSLSRTPVPAPLLVKANELNITYKRIVLPESNCSDVFISVRTTAQFHRSRLLLLLYTWLQTVNPKQVVS